MANDYDGQPLYGKHVTELMRRINALQDAVSADFILSWGSVGSGDGQFNGSYACYIAIYNDEVFVSDWALNRIQVFDLNGTFRRKWTVGAVTGIAIIADEIYCCTYSRGGDELYVYDLNGNLQRQWSTPGGLHSSEIYGGEIYCTATLNHRVEVWTTAGVYQRTWGGWGWGDGRFEYPSGIAIYNDEVFVSDLRRIQVFDLNGTFRRKWTAASAILTMVGDELYAAYGGVGVYIYDVNGVLNQSWGSSMGDGDGQFGRAGGIDVDSSGYTYVFDYCSSVLARVQKFDGAIPKTQIEFSGYTASASASLGTPDSGATVPGNNALVTGGYDVVPNHITDMRDALEALAPAYRNGATSNLFNWTASDADNLYYVAMGDRTKYGATGGAQYDWTRTLGQMNGTPPYDIDIGEILECVATLEGSNPI